MMATEDMTTHDQRAGLNRGDYDDGANDTYADMGDDISDNSDEPSPAETREEYDSEDEAYQNIKRASMLQ